jgi:hypothetical protein
MSMSTPFYLVVLALGLGLAACSSGWRDDRPGQAGLAPAPVVHSMNYVPLASSSTAPGSVQDRGAVVGQGSGGPQPAPPLPPQPLPPQAPRGTPTSPALLFPSPAPPAAPIPGPVLPSPSGESSLDRMQQQMNRDLIQRQVDRMQTDSQGGLASPGDRAILDQRQFDLNRLNDRLMH